jgi:hypothetical protein
VSLERRLARLEGSLSPSDAVLGWLTEAQAYPTLPAYVASLVDGPADVWPLVRIGAAVDTAVRGTLRGKPKNAVWTAVRRAVGDAYFLVELVVGINLAAEEICRVEGLRWALLSQWMRALLLEAELAGVRVDCPPGADGPSVREIDAWRAGLAGSLTTVYADEAARSHIEERYLRGCGVRFSTLVSEWEALRQRLEGLAVRADQVPTLHGSGSVALVLAELRETSAAAGSTRSAELTETARIRALDLLGEDRRAAAIATRWMRPKPVAGPVADAAPAELGAEGEDVGPMHGAR